MTDRPYTDADLRAEAARQHLVLTMDPDFMGVSEQMDGAQIASLATRAENADADGITWDSLNREQFDAAQDKIADLINGAADVSEWAVALGADGLEPGTRVIDIGWNDSPLQARIHIAYAPDMPQEEREQLAADLSDLIAGTVPVR